MIFSCMSINVSPHGVVAMSSTATVAITFWRSVSKSALPSLIFRFLCPEEWQYLSLPSAHNPMSPKIYLLNCTLQGTDVSLHHILSNPPSDECCSTQYLFIDLLSLASWMIFSKPYKIPHQLIGWLISNKSERIYRNRKWGNSCKSLSLQPLSWTYLNVLAEHDLELRHPHFVCNVKVQCKDVKNTSSLLSVIILLIERHVSTYSEAIIRFYKC